MCAVHLCRGSVPRRGERVGTSVMSGRADCIDGSDSYLTCPHISTCSHSRTLESGEVELMCAPSHLTLSLHCPAEPVELSLFEPSAAECRSEMKRALFSVWDSLSATTSKLTGRCCQCGGRGLPSMLLCSSVLLCVASVAKDQCLIFLVQNAKRNCQLLRSRRHWSSLCLQARGYTFGKSA